MSAAPRTPPIVDPPIRLAVCVSGGGTTLQNLIGQVKAGRLRADIIHVVASKPGIGAIARAEAAGIAVSVAVRGSFPGRAEFSAAVFEPIRQARADLVVLGGFLALIDI